MAILVDTNLHVIAPEHARAQYPLNIYEGTEEEFSEHQSRSPEKLIELMKEAGIHQGYLMASRFHGFDNSYCADAANKYPEYFVGVANINIFDPSAPDHISYWIQERHMQGVRFWGGGPVAGHRYPGDTRGLATYVDDPLLEPAWERVVQLKVPVNAQTTMPAALPNTRRLLEKFPELRFTLNNLAHVPVSEGASSQAAKDLLSLAEYRGTYVNFSTTFLQQTVKGEGARELLDALVDSYGSRRLLWSTFGNVSGGAVRVVRQAISHLPTEDQENILGEGARDLYPRLRARLPN